MAVSSFEIITKLWKSLLKISIYKAPQIWRIYLIQFIKGSGFPSVACGHSEFSCAPLHMYVTAVTVVMQLSPHAHRHHGYIIVMEEAKEKRVKAG